jgi:DNA polymerase-3 subunit gamma/tau
MNELHRKYRPQRLLDVQGQDEAIATIKSKFKHNTVPHALLFHGPSGCGKTTLARIVATMLGCKGRHDFSEMNVADYRGIDSVRDIRRQLNQRPLEGSCRVYLLDECHRLTPDAQNAMLKIIEEPPDHVYFMLCTTEPEKLIRTLRSRPMEVRLRPLDADPLISLLRIVSKSERIPITKPVAVKIADMAMGSAREALQILDVVREHRDAAAMLKHIDRATVGTQAIYLARKLLDTRSKWNTIAPLLNDLKNEEPERLRYMILGYTQSVLLKKRDNRAFRMMELFLDNTFDSKFAGIVSASYQVIHGQD